MDTQEILQLSKIDISTQKGRNKIQNMNIKSSDLISIIRLFENFRMDVKKYRFYRKRLAISFGLKIYLNGNMPTETILEINKIIKY
jgi:hypothetical protein